MENVADADKEKVRSGQWSMVSFLLVMLFLGGPIWWKTTEVYRVSLPYADIENLTQLLDLQLRVNLQLVTTDVKKDHQWGPLMQEHLQASEVYQYFLSSRAPTAEELRITKEAKDMEELDLGLSRIHKNFLTGSVLIFEISNNENLMKDIPIILGNHKCVFFNRKADPKVLVKVIREIMLGETPLKKMIQSIESPRHKDKDSGILRKTEAAKGYDISFSLLVPEPEKVRVSWDISNAINDYVEPLIKNLNNFSSFSVKSQVLYLTKLNLKPSKEDNGLNVVSHKKLGLAINLVESQLASHVSKLPRLKYVVYIPPREESPLHIVTQDGNILKSNSFLIPRWGGVQIYNVDIGEGKTDLNMANVMGIFISQLRLLLGLQDYEPVEKVQFLSLNKDSIRLWERDYLYRLRTLENLVLTRVTLQSLAHLLTKISNIVINDDIGEEVHNAVDSSQNAATFIKDGKLEEAFEASKIAFQSSNKAFFDPSLLALLYFPEDQKYAIYIPLFLPVGIPILISVQTLYVLWKNRKTG